MITNATDQELKTALKIVNNAYDGNIQFNRFERHGNRISFTLKVKDSHKLGTRLGYPNSGKQHLASACWHVHGNFFDALFDINPAIWVKTRGRRIDKNGGNWEDWNAGSLLYPIMMSELCLCNK
ncbi:MAG: hypothetical protein ACUVUQ_11660 [Thermodesulfovibrionales bacterium]